MECCPISSAPSVGARRRHGPSCALQASPRTLQTPSGSLAGLARSYAVVEVLECCSYLTFDVSLGFVVVSLITRTLKAY